MGEHAIKHEDGIGSYCLLGSHDGAITAVVKHRWLDTARAVWSQRCEQAIDERLQIERIAKIGFRRLLPEPIAVNARTMEPVDPDANVTAYGISEFQTDTDHQDLRT